MRARLTLPVTGAVKAVMQWLTGERIDGSVIGGVAVSLLARPRITRDVDAVILAEDRDWQQIIDSARAYGIEPREDDIVDFARHTRVLLLRHSKSHVDIDVSLGGLPFERELVARSAIATAGRLRVRLPAIEDLLVMKALARRGRDFIDIEDILDVHENVDLDHVRRWLREFSSVLDMPEIQEDFEQLLRRRKRRRP
jgi:Nucleotidyl transferase of unknown function (DUF2204)